MIRRLPRRIAVVGPAVASIAVLWAACAPRREPRSATPVIAPAEIRVAIATGIPAVAVSADRGLVIVTPARRAAIHLAGGRQVTLSPGPTGITVDLPGAVPASDRWELRSADRSGTVRFAGHDYPGVVIVTAQSRGLAVVDRLSLETYVAGVVSAEMGHRAASDLEALKAQAVVSRTYAVRHRDLSGSQPYDLVAVRDDQVFDGTTATDALALRATRATAGEILTYHGAPIDAFFCSTCGGRTEDGTAVFPGADRPYLRSVSDLAPDGHPWCAISPRYSWREHWSADELRRVLAATLPANGFSADRGDDLTDIAVTATTPSGRAAAVTLGGNGGSTVVSGQAIRRVLAPAGGGMLWSTQFTVRVSRQGETIEAVDLSGHGSGHGVGMCQWGAIGRARAGQDYTTILSSYFPGTIVQRVP